MFGRFGVWEILVIVLLVVVLFGHAKIPGMMKNLADGVKVFKKEMKDGTSEHESASKKATVKKAAVKKSASKKAVAKKAKSKKVVTKK